MAEKEYTVDLKKRRFLTAATSVVGAVGVASITVPFLSSLAPSAKAKAAGVPVDIDISKLEEGQLVRVLWRKKPVFVFRRSKANITNLADVHKYLADPDSSVTSQQPNYAKNATRSIKEDIGVIIGTCTHLGCLPTFRPEIAPDDLGPNWQGGFYCPCHGSRFDLAGRVYKGVPAPTNLEIPPYSFSSDNLIRIGINPSKKQKISNG